MSRGTLVRLEDLLGARVVGVDGRRVGRIEEVCVARREGEYQVMEYLLGAGAVLERWSCAENLFGFKGRKLTVRWDQIDISNPARPRLTCPLDEIETDGAKTR